MTRKSAPPSNEDIWRKYDSVEQRLSAQLSERMLDLGRLRQGMHVLSLATGRGEPAIPLLREYSPEEMLSVSMSIEVTSDDELIARARAFGMSKSLQELSGCEQIAWERELISAAEPYRTGEGSIRLGGSSRLVVAA